jgi:hypothetical protein
VKGLGRMHDGGSRRGKRRKEGEGENGRGGGKAGGGWIRMGKAEEGG